MSTTTIRIPEKLKTRVARAAKQAGTTAHGFMLEAIAEKTEAAEQRSGFLREADARFTEIVASGSTLAWSDVRRLLLSQASSESSSRTRTRKSAG